MLILGLSDGPVPNAAVLDGGVLKGATQGPELWACAAEALAQAGRRRDEVTLVAVAGRYTPPLWARQRGVHAEAHDPFRPRLFAGTAVQVGLRRSGIGAWEADRATEWFEAQVRAHGYAPRWVALVDAHRCLAAFAYRSQPQDDALVVVVHPRGDGVLVSVHRGRAGQVDRLAADRATTSAHLWLDRCLWASGLVGREEEVLTATGEVDGSLLTALRETLWTTGTGGLAAARLVRRGGLPWRTLAAQGVQAAPTIAAHLRGVLAELVAAVHLKYGGQNLAVAGSWMRDPRLVAALARLPGVQAVWAGPLVGRHALGAGAALSMGGTAPSLPTIDRIDDEMHGSPASVAASLARGEGVAVRGPFHYAAWVRADDSVAWRRAREALRRPLHEAPELVTLPDAVAVEGAEALAGPLRYGTAAPVLRLAPAGLGLQDAGSPVRVVSNGFAAQVLAGLREQVGCGAVVALPLAFDGAPGVRTVAAAASVCASSGIVWPS